MTSCSCTPGLPTPGCGGRSSGPLGREHRVIAFDLPGYGNAALEPGPLSYVDYVSERLEAPAAVVCCSFGASIGLELAVTRPELVEQLVLIGTGLAGWDWSEGAKAGFAEEEAALERGDLEAAAAAQARMWLADDADDDRRRADQAMTARSYEQQLPVEDQVEVVWPEPRAATRLADVRCPTLVLVGDRGRCRHRWRSPSARGGDPGRATGRRSRAPAICRASSARTSSTGCCSTSFADDGVRERGPRRLRPFAELAVGQRRRSASAAPDRPRGTSRAELAEVAERRRRVQRPGPVRRLRVLELEPSPQSSGSKRPKPGRTPSRPGNGTDGRLGERLGRDERRREQLAGEAERRRRASVDVRAAATPRSSRRVRAA